MVASGAMVAFFAGCVKRSDFDSTSFYSLGDLQSWREVW